MNDRNVGLGGLLRKYRLNTGVTQRQLAELSTLSERAIRDLESGRARFPRRDTVRLLADALRLGETGRAALEAAAQRHPIGAGPAQVPSLPPAARIDALIGRESERKSLIELLSAGSQRWITLVGLGGVGKTTLAREVATGIHEEGFSVAWIPPIDDDATTEPDSNGSLLGKALLRSDFDLDGVLRSIGAPDTVLIVDGHDATRSPAHRIVALLRQCPHLRVLVTSRAPYNVPGECVFPLGPLALPTPSEEADLPRLAQVPSVRLLLMHLRKMRPGFQLHNNATVVAALCRQLDGLPAAVQISAEWSLIHSPEQLLAQLTNDPFRVISAPEAQRTGFDIHESVRSALATLEPGVHKAIIKLADETSAWSVDDLVKMMRISSYEAARVAHSLLVLGLIRHSEADDSRFTLLNLVRQVQLEIGGSFAGRSRRHIS
ncbi:helix-turn-helix domain-containing protein [Saccharopolyspora sp. NPDC003752]